jgi:hypothetical protein
MSTTAVTWGDPKGMRPSTNRRDFGFGDPIGEHPLSDGRTAWVLWLPATATHVHVTVWVPGTDEILMAENVARFNAAPLSERFLRELET